MIGPDRVQVRVNVGRAQEAGLQTLARERFHLGDQDRGQLPLVIETAAAKAARLERIGEDREGGLLHGGALARRQAPQPLQHRVGRALGIGQLRGDATLPLELRDQGPA